MTEDQKEVIDLEKLAGETPPELSPIDQAMEKARKAQEEEILHEQVRMERLHVSAMVLQGLLASGKKNAAEAMADDAVKYADALLKRVTE